MIATRFKYDYSLADAFKAACSLFLKHKRHFPEIFNKLFPQSKIYYTSSARVGLKYIIKSFNLKEGATIGVQPYTCSSVLSSITAAGYTPLFIDINDQLSLDIVDLTKKIGKLDALIVTHIFGFPENIEKIKEIAYNIPVVEDCAHALFSQHNHQQLGTFFDASVFSFGNGKFPSLGEGGLAVVNNLAYNAYVSDHLLQLPTPGMVAEIKNILRSYVAALMHTPLGYKLTSVVFSKKYIQDRSKEVYKYPSHEHIIYKSVSSLLKYKMPKTEKRSKQQYENGSYLAMQLENKFHILKREPDAVNYFAFPVLTDNRDALFNYLKDKGIICGKHFHHALDWVLQFGYQKGECPVFEKYVDKVLTIPCNYSLKQEQLNIIIQSLNTNSIPHNRQKH